ncbi:MAG TPA: hypothetical protein VFN10_20050 [Thermoanaerobaculia bacterium]|nr:hypothetical protein [Thermoanaerobaculia bacterium]
MKTAAFAVFALVVVALVASPATAGVIYDFTTTLESGHGAEKVNGRVWADGEAYRAEVTRDGTPVVVISRDANVTAKLLFPKKQTWANRARAGAPRSSSLFIWPMAGAYVPDEPKVTYRRGETITIAGRKATEHQIEATFVVESQDMDSTLRGTYSVKARIWTTKEFPALPLGQLLRTGYYLVDQQLDAIVTSLDGMVLRHDLEVSRTFQGGPPQIERTSTVVQTLTLTEIPAAQFEVPETYQYAGPVTQTRE